MLSNLNRFGTAQVFKDALFDLLVRLEAPKTTVYKDTANPPKATIGVGFNLTVQDVLNQVLIAWGLDPANITADQQTPDALSLIFTNNTLTAAQMQMQANAEMAQRSSGQQTFQYPAGTAGLAEMRSVFNVLAPDYTQSAITLLNGLGAPGFLTTDWSRELIALTSLAYNGGSLLIGQKLADAIRDDNRAAAWWEIAIGSNKNNIFGVQNRRMDEAAYFGMYGGEWGQAWYIA